MLASFLKRDLRNLFRKDASPNFQAQNGLLSLRSRWRSVRSLRTGATIEAARVSENVSPTAVENDAAARQCGLPPLTDLENLAWDGLPELAQMVCATDELESLFTEATPGADRIKVDESGEFDFNQAIRCSQNDVWTFFDGKGRARGGTLLKMKESRDVIDFRKQGSRFWVIMKPADVEQFRQHVEQRNLEDKRGRTRKN